MSQAPRGSAFREWISQRELKVFSHACISYLTSQGISQRELKVSRFSMEATGSRRSESHKENWKRCKAFKQLAEGQCSMNLTKRIESRSPRRGEDHRSQRRNLTKRIESFCNMIRVSALINRISQRELKEGWADGADDRQHGRISQRELKECCPRKNNIVGSVRNLTKRIESSLFIRNSGRIDQMNLTKRIERSGKRPPQHWSHQRRNLTKRIESKEITSSRPFSYELNLTKRIERQHRGALI